MSVHLDYLLEPGNVTLIDIVDCVITTKEAFSALPTIKRFKSEKRLFHTVLHITIRELEN